MFNKLAYELSLNFPIKGSIERINGHDIKEDEEALNQHSAGVRIREGFHGSPIDSFRCVVGPAGNKSRPPLQGGIVFAFPFKKQSSVNVISLYCKGCIERERKNV
jgi:hypothetical protein